MRRAPLTAADLLDRLHLEPLSAGEYWHVYSTAYGALASRPNSPYRLGLVTDHPPGLVSRPSFYLGWSPEAALWETALRDVAAVHGAVTLQAAWTHGRGLARLKLNRDREVVPLDQPFRRNVIDPNTTKNVRWDRHLIRPTYKATHVAAGVIDAQFRADGKVLPGFRWYSKQIQGDLVAVMYEPAFDPNDWAIVEQFDLDSSKGRLAISDALLRAKMYLVGSLSAVGGTPLTP